MLLFYLVFIILFIIGIKVEKDNWDYLSKEETTIINGLFVITIFFSHFMTYITPNNYFDIYMLKFLRFVGQLMVTSFLFYSGYGIYESIKNKEKYMKFFVKKRFFPIYFNFIVAIILFIIINAVIGNNYSIKSILLAFTGYESIGNSNWYMLAIFVLYFFVIICFNSKMRIKNIYRIILLTFLSIIYMFVITRFKDSYYANTLLCFPLGMYYSYFKDKINKKLKSRYYLCVVIATALLIISYYINSVFSNFYIYNMYAMCFIIIVVFLTEKVKIKSSIMTFLGTNTFWIYILQRIPMIIFQNKLNNYVYFLVCIIITVMLAFFMNQCTKKMLRRIITK